MGIDDRSRRPPGGLGALERRRGKGRARLSSPDVFDAGEFPAACLPTIYVTHGRRERRPGTDLRSRPGEQWYVTLFLEPEVERDAEIREDRPAAIAAARDLSDRFARGDLDYRGLYQVPREVYLDRLDELTGRAGGDG